MKGKLVHELNDESVIKYYNLLKDEYYKRKLDVYIMKQKYLDDIKSLTLDDFINGDFLYKIYE